MGRASSVLRLAPASAGRRLVAVAFADIVGYSVLMARDELTTHARWMTLLNDVLRPFARQHRGRVVKSTGDGVLAEFASALDAVEWGRAILAATLQLNNQLNAAGDPTSPPIVFRLGMHLGDVFESEDDIYGDGVNIAARLQEYAEPGGIVLSAAIHDLVRGALSEQARDLGFLSLKNFEFPVHAYALDPPRDRFRNIPTLPNRGALPSIAVLPFRNLGPKSADEYFGEGLVEDIIVSLSGLRELIVIARNSTIKYRQRQPDIREAGRVLGVRYLTTGSIRRSPDRVRVSTHLFDVQSGATLWSDTTDTPQGDLFDVQDRIVQRIVAGIAPHVRAEELRRALRKRPDSFTAYDYTLRALDLLSKLNRSTYNTALEYLKRAMSEDSNFALPTALAARWHSINIGQGWSVDHEDDTRQSWILATRALELDPQSALALSTYAHLKSRLFRDFDGALIYFDRALSVSPSSSLSWSLSSLTLSYVGEGERAIKHAEHALMLSPLDQAISFYYTSLGFAYFAAGEFEQAVKWTQMAEGENPRFTANLRILAAALATLGRLTEARKIAANIVNCEPDFSLLEYERSRQPFRDRDIARRLLAGLRESGLPD